ncbi:hypothetical protein E1A91_A09G172700v1 [Gossypium mustelinum]|uniref:Uncharacterized protein n=1 Tax=Gossypium mustelinum TaxID=34275 RepID=A0A5D2XYY7_GOSMU|nr:hypothetical protein E1A91_A09G172700v1 [Gossypium mustelinum]
MSSNSKHNKVIQLRVKQKKKKEFGESGKLSQLLPHQSTLFPNRRKRKQKKRKKQGKQANGPSVYKSVTWLWKRQKVR